MNKWATIQILAINPNTTLIRSPGVSNTDQIVSTWGVLTRTVTTRRAQTKMVIPLRLWTQGTGTCERRDLGAALLTFFWQPSDIAQPGVYPHSGHLNDSRVEIA